MDIQDLPDPTIGKLELRDYGYTAEDMVPLRKAAALDYHRMGSKIYCLGIFLHFLRFYSCYHVSRHISSSCIPKSGITGRTFFLPNYAIFPVFLFQTEVPFSIFPAILAFPLAFFFINLQFLMDRTTCRSFFFLF